MIPLLIVNKDNDERRSGLEDSDSVEEEGHTQVAASLLETHGNEDPVVDQFFAQNDSMMKGHSRAASDISLVVTM